MNIQRAIAVPLRELLDEPMDVRLRVAKKLHALAHAIGDSDRARSRALEDVATLLERGSFIPAGASVDW